MSTQESRTLPDLDEFTRKRLSDGLSDTFFSIRKQVQRASDAMLMGLLAASFTDDEFDVLCRCRLISQHEETLMKRARHAKDTER